MPSYIRGNDNFDTAGGNAVKAWVNFNGTGTVAIRASYNVTSITDNGTGDYTVNFTNAMTDANYSAVWNIGGSLVDVSDNVRVVHLKSFSTTSARMITVRAGSGSADWEFVSASFFR